MNLTRVTGSSTPDMYPRSVWIFFADPSIIA